MDVLLNQLTKVNNSRVLNSFLGAVFTVVNLNSSLNEAVASSVQQPVVNTH